MPERTALPAAPTSLALTQDVDGWTVDLARRSPQAMVALGAAVAVAGVGAATFTVFAGGTGAVMTVVGAIVLGILGVGGFMVWQASRKQTVSTTATHLVLVRGRTRERIPWAQVAPPKITRRMVSQMRTRNGNTTMVDVEVPRLVLRWTTDGREAAFAHEGTDWDQLTVEGRTEEELAWLRAALDAAREAALERAKAQAFDELVQGRPGEKAKAELEALRGSREG